MIVEELGEAARVGAMLLVVLGSLCLRSHVELPCVGGRLLVEGGDTPVVAQQGRLGAGFQGQVLGCWVGRQVRVRMSQQVVGWLRLHEVPCERGIVVGVVMRLRVQSLWQAEVGWLESVIEGL